jgi:hypothetical protein
MNISTVGVLFFNGRTDPSDATTYGLCKRSGPEGVVIFYTPVLLNIPTAGGIEDIFPLFSTGYRIF